MNTIKAVLAAISGFFAIYSILGLVLRITGVGRIVPMLAWNSLLQLLPPLLIQVINVLIFSIYPALFVLSKRRSNKDRRRVRYT